MGRPVRICVLISGGGTNLQALIDALTASPPRINAEICCVISSKPAKAEERENRDIEEPYGLERAKRAGLPHRRLTKGSLPPEYQIQKSDPPDVQKRKNDDARLEYDKRLAELVLAVQPHLVICLGYMRILQPVFLNQLHQHGIEIVNLHPALPGEYDGVDAIGRAHRDWKDGKITRTGVMIHRVIEAVDAGAVVAKQEISFESPADDNVDDFEQKVHRAEWKLVVEGVGKMVDEINKQWNEGSPA